jgi:hypothetical protein
LGRGGGEGNARIAMSISTFSELKTAIASWLHRSDLTSQIPDAITFAEAKFNRRIRVRQMETAMAATSIVSGLVTRPTGLLEVKALWNTDEAKTRVEAKPLEYVLSQKWTGYGLSTTDATAAYYAWDRTYFRFNTDSGEVEGTYYASIDALSDSTTTNWLLTASPDLYLAASLAEIFLLNMEEERAALWTSKANALIEELNRVDQRARFSGNGLAVKAV